MAQVFIPGWILVTLTAKQGTEFYHYNFTYLSTSGVPTDAQLLAIATDVYNRFAPGLSPLTATDVTYTQCSARDMHSNAGHEQVYVPTAPVVGTASGDSEPANVCAVMSYAPLNVGKGVKGRSFIS